MASPVGGRDGHVKRPRCVGLIFLPAAALALTAMLAAGCGGGDDPRPKVEAGLQHYFSTFNPEDSIFPYGAGAPRVIDNGCKDLHRKPRFVVPSSSSSETRSGSGRMFPPPQVSGKFKNLALWQCLVRFDA